MVHNRVFSTETSTHPEVTSLTQWSGWYPQANPDWIPDLAAQQAWKMGTLLAPLPQGKRVLFLRQMLRHETAWADPLILFENGHLKVSHCIQFLRPLGRELRRLGIHLDGVWSDNEGSASYWALTTQQLTAVLTSPKARAKMPPAVRALNIEMFYGSHPNFVNAILTFNRYADLLMHRSFRLALVDSGVLKTRPAPGAALVQPPTSNFWISAPTFPIYDYNNWPINSFSLDGRTSSPSCYLSAGNRYNTGPVHAPHWNALVDQVNYARSIMRRPGAMMWPTIAWPSARNPWLFEQMVAHFTRTGVNWTAGNCAYIYWRDPNVSNGAVEDPLMADIFSRHDQPFGVQRNLPEVSLDCDSITTAGFTTTYADYLDHMPWP